MKATLTYRCDEPGHEQRARITVEGDFDNKGKTDMKLTMKFEPDVGDDTSDPSGLLNAMIQSLQMLTGGKILRD